MEYQKELKNIKNNFFMEIGKEESDSNNINYKTNTIFSKINSICNESCRSSAIKNSELVIVLVARIIRENIFNYVQKYNNFHLLKVKKQHRSQRNIVTLLEMKIYPIIKEYEHHVIVKNELSQTQVLLKSSKDIVLIRKKIDTDKIDRKIYHAILVQEDGIWLHLNGSYDINISREIILKKYRNLKTTILSTKEGESYIYEKIKKMNTSISQ